jgi:hypothetical protein
MRRSDLIPRAVATTALAISLLALPGMAAWANPPQQLCQDNATDDEERPIPQSLVPAAVRLFGLEAMPVEEVGRSTVYRCAAGRVLVCNLGANLPCGKANTSRNLPAAEAWCAENSGSDFIPMYVTGHDTIYRWRCDGTKASTIGGPLETDQRGFISRYWKPVDAAAAPQR